MRKTFLFIAAVCCGALLTACGGSSNSSESTNDGVLGELDELVQEYYTQSNAMAALGPIWNRKTGDEFDTDKAYEISPKVIEAYNKLMEAKEQAIGREMPTTVHEGAPLKVVKPMTVVGIRVGPNDIGNYRPNEVYDKKTQDSEYALVLRNGYLIVKLEGEVELTEDVRAQEPRKRGFETYYDNCITCYGYNGSDSIMVVSGAYGFNENEPLKAGTRLKIAFEIKDECHHPSEGGENCYYINNINQTKRFEFNCDAATSAAMGDNAVTGELGLFELQGPVKKCTVLNDWGSVERTFDEQGFWKTHDGKPLSEVYPGGIKRDEYGRIIKGMVDTEGNGEDYSYNKFGKVSKYNSHIYDSIEEDVYTYDDNGNLLKKHVEMGGMDAEEPYDETYTDVVTDDKGNWTSRKANGEVQKRKIEYYN